MILCTILKDSNQHMICSLKYVIVENAYKHDQTRCVFAHKDCQHSQTKLLVNTKYLDNIV